MWVIKPTHWPQSQSHSVSILGLDLPNFWPESFPFCFDQRSPFLLFGHRAILILILFQRSRYLCYEAKLAGTAHKSQLLFSVVYGQHFLFPLAVSSVPLPFMLLTSIVLPWRRNDLYSVEGAVKPYKTYKANHV